jgi:toxin-antitoxin system PIN domain toxin
VFLIDANVLLHAANADSPEHATCHRLVTRWRVHPQPWYSTWGVLYEFMRVATHQRVFRRPWTVDRALDFVRVLLASPSFEVLHETDRHPLLLAETLTDVPGARGSVFHDVHTAVLMREHGIHRIVTRDTGFRRFPFLEVLDPRSLG